MAIELQILTEPFKAQLRKNMETCGGDHAVTIFTRKKSEVGVFSINRNGSNYTYTFGDYTVYKHGKVSLEGKKLFNIINNLGVYFELKETDKMVIIKSGTNTVRMNKEPLTDYFFPKDYQERQEFQMPLIKMFKHLTSLRFLPVMRKDAQYCNTIRFCFAEKSVQMLATNKSVIGITKVQLPITVGERTLYFQQRDILSIANTLSKEVDTTIAFGDGWICFGGKTSLMFCTETNEIIPSAIDGLLEKKVGELEQTINNIDPEEFLRATKLINATITDDNLIEEGLALRMSISKDTLKQGILLEIKGLFESYIHAKLTDNNKLNCYLNHNFLREVADFLVTNRCRPVEFIFTDKKNPIIVFKSQETIFLINPYNEDAYTLGGTK